MGDVYFNELSLLPDCCQDEEINDRVRQYANVLKRCGELGHKKVRYEKCFEEIAINERQSLMDYCVNSIHNPLLNTYVSLILSMQCQPYIAPGTPQEALYLCKKYEIDLGTKSEEGYGMTAAYLSSSFAVGFHSSDLWNNCSFSINIIDDNGNSKTDKVFCISAVCHFEDDDFADWYACHYKICYTPRSQTPSCHLRSDHGINELMEFSKKILKEDFIEKIINSLENNSKARKFIEHIGEDGVIKIRLTWTKRGLGIAVKTVGINKIQCHYFARLLTDKYDK